MPELDEDDEDDEDDEEDEDDVAVPLPLDEAPVAEDDEEAPPPLPLVLVELVLAPPSPELDAEDEDAPLAELVLEELLLEAPVLEDDELPRRASVMPRICWQPATAINEATPRALAGRERLLGAGAPFLERLVLSNPTLT